MITNYYNLIFDNFDVLFKSSTKTNYMCHEYGTNEFRCIFFNNDDVVNIKENINDFTNFYSLQIKNHRYISYILRNNSINKDYSNFYKNSIYNYGMYISTKSPCYSNYNFEHRICSDLLKTELQQESSQQNNNLQPTNNDNFGFLLVSSCILLIVFITFIKSFFK